MSISLDICWLCLGPVARMARASRLDLGRGRGAKFRLGYFCYLLKGREKDLGQGLQLSVGYGEVGYYQSSRLVVKKYQRAHPILMLACWSHHGILARCASLFPRVNAVDSSPTVYPFTPKMQGSTFYKMPRTRQIGLSAIAAFAQARLSLWISQVTRVGKLVNQYSIQ